MSEHRGGVQGPGEGGSEASVRARHAARFDALLPAAVERVDWPLERVRRARRRALRELISVAVARSPWHRERLAGIAPAELGDSDLGALPVMTKSDLMEHFDDIVTDRRLTRERCERHLESQAEYLLGEYEVVASGGSSAQRGVFVYGWDAWATCWASNIRFQHRDWSTDPALAEVPRIIAAVAASNATHFSAAVGRTFSTARNPRVLFPVSRPLDQIVAGLNEVQPTVLMAYSSYLPWLAAEARAGRLRIAPRRVLAISEPLLPEARAALQEVWDVPIGSSYGMSEGVFAGFCGRSSHLPDDLCLVEPVDEEGRPVPAGRRSHSVYITNLYNLALPLIRYLVTDEVTVLEGPCACGSVFRRIADPQGRLDETFRYRGGASVHPHVFRSVLGRNPGILEYRVHQSERGADVHLVARTPVDTPAIAHQLQRSLASLGLPRPQVTVTPVDALERQPSGKLKRFVPLPG